MTDRLVLALRVALVVLALAVLVSWFVPAMGAPVARESVRGGGHIGSLSLSFPRDRAVGHSSGPDSPGRGGI